METKDDGRQAGASLSPVGNSTTPRAAVATEYIPEGVIHRSTTSGAPLCSPELSTSHFTVSVQNSRVATDAPVAALTLETIPEDMLVGIFGYLSAPDAARVCCVSRLMRQRAGNDALWTQLFISDWDVAAKELPLLRSGPKECYRRRLAQRRTRLKTANLRRIQEDLQSDATSRQVGVSACVGTSIICSLFVFPFVLVVAFLVTAAKQLDGDNGGASWWQAATPVWVWGGLWLLGVALSLCVIACGSRCSNHLSAFHGIDNRLAGVPTVSCVNHLRTGRVTWYLSRFYLFCFAALLVAIPIVLCAKFEQSDNSAFPWAAAFAPIWALGILAFCCCCITQSTDKDVALFIGNMCLALGCPIFITLALVSASVDGGKDIPIVKILIPLWLPFGIVMCGASCIMCGSLIKFLWDRDWMEAGIIFCFGVGLVAAFGPPVLTLIFIVLRMQGVLDLSWKKVFAPLWVWFGILAVGACVASVAYWYDVIGGKVVAVWRESRDPFATAAQSGEFRVRAVSV